MDKFTESYIECALWLSNDESTPEGGNPIDDNYSVEDIAPQILTEMEADCKKFQKENFDDLNVSGVKINGNYTTDELAGHDFWLTRNGHGAGFWDGDWPESAGKRLTKASKKFGEYLFYVGEDGKIWGNKG